MTSRKIELSASSASSLRERIASLQAEGCWLWDGKPNHNGYGTVHLRSGTRAHYLAHRVAYTIYKGEIPDGLLVCHRCDVRLCVNPEHLFLGSHLDNTRDALAKGRLARGVNHGLAKTPAARVRGTRHGCAVLTESDVRAIRLASSNGERIVRLSEQYGVSPRQIRNIINGTRWAHLLSKEPP